MHFASAIKVDFFVAGGDRFEVERLAIRERWATRLNIVDLFERVMRETMICPL